MRPTLIRRLIGTCVALSLLSSPVAAAPWRFDLSNVVTYQAWIGTESVYLLLPQAGNNLNQPIHATPGLQPLTYPNREGYSGGPLLAALDLATGNVRWARAYRGEWTFVLDPDGRDLWGLSSVFDRIDAITGKSIKRIPFAPRQTSNDPKAWRIVNGIRRDDRVAWGTTRFGRDAADPVHVYDVDTNDVDEVQAVNARSHNRLDQFDLAIDQSPELVQTHVQRRPIGGGNATWRFSTGGYSQNRPVPIGKDDVLALTGMPTTIGRITRLNGETGEPRWSTPLPRGAYSIEQSQFKDGWYGAETWSATGPLDETRLFAIGGDGTIYILDAEHGAILGKLWLDPVVICPPKLVGDQLVVVTERAAVSVPMAVVLGQAALPEVATRLETARQALAAKRPKDAVAAAQAATDLWPTDRTAWHALAETSRAAGDESAAVRASVRELELSGEATTDWLRQRYGLLSRIDTGALRAPIASVGLFIYAASTDGQLYVIDPDQLTVTEQRAMGGDAQSLVLRGTELIRRGEDRRSETVLSTSRAPTPPVRRDRLWPALDERLSRRPSADIEPADRWPREFTTVGGPYGPAMTLNGRLVRAVSGGGIRELKEGKVIDYPAVLDGVDRWRLEPTAVGVFGCGKGGLFELDENLRPKRFLIDLRSAGSDRGMPEVHGADADGQTLAVAFEKPVWPHMLTIEVRSADASKVLRSESVLPPGRFDSIEEEPARLSKLGDGYFYAGGELAWIPTDPAKPVWRFRANDDPNAPRTNVRNDPIDRSFGVPRVREGRLFVPCAFGGVFVFDVETITR